MEYFDPIAEDLNRLDGPGPPRALTGEFQAAFGESLQQALDLTTWMPGADLTAMYARLEQEVAEAVDRETDVQLQIREHVFPRLATRSDAPPDAGVYQVTRPQVESVHRKLLFNGGTEACDGIVISHDTLPLTITQIGVCLVSYHGDQGSWVHRMFRRDLRTGSDDPVRHTMDLLDARTQRGAVDHTRLRDTVSNLARRGIMAYAERAALLDRSQAVWRMGHGSPAPYELVTGCGIPELLEAGLDLMQRLIDFERFVFVPSATDARELLTIGQALRPLEYAIIDHHVSGLLRIGRGNYRGQHWGELGRQVEIFAQEYGRKLVIGMYRASHLAPCQMFYAHRDHAHEAALIAMADSVLQEHRGFPMLIDLADMLCGSTLGSDAFNSATSLAYARAEAPFRYMGERSMRPR